MGFLGREGSGWVAAGAVVVLAGAAAGQPSGIRAAGRRAASAIVRPGALASRLGEPLGTSRRISGRRLASRRYLASGSRRRERKMEARERAAADRRERLRREWSRRQARGVEAARLLHRKKKKRGY